MSRPGVVIVAIGMAMALGIAGCGEDTSTDAADTASDATGVADGEGEGAGGASLDGVPIPLPPGAEAVTTSEAGPATIVQFIVPIDQQQATIDFYDEWTEAQAEDYIRIEAESGGVSWQNDPESGADKNIIAVVSPLDGADVVTVTLTTGPFV